MKPLSECPDIKKFSREEQLEAIKRRLEIRRAYLNAKIDRVLRQDINKTASGEDIRAWMDSFANGVGLDICCGNYLTEGAIGVDSAYNVLGNSFNFQGDNLAGFPAESMDYIVCNYADCFDNPLKVLNEWKRVLKVGGKIAFVVSNADCYEASDNMLNGKRLFLYTPHTIELYLMKVFGNCKVRTHLSMILATAIK